MATHLVLVETGAGQAVPAASTAGPRVAGEIVQLPHPKTARQHRFMCYGKQILELQRVSQTTPCSWFIDQTVQSDGSILVASRIDPVFFLLPLLARNGSRYSPLSQYLVPSGANDAAVSLLKTVDGVHAAMASLCDVNSTMGDGPDDLLYRLNRSKATCHLAARVSRLARVMQTHGEVQQARLKAQMGSFSAASTSLTAPASSPVSFSSSSSSSSSSGGSSSSSSSLSRGAGNSPVAQSDLVAALGVFGEYVEDTWTEEVAAHLQVPLSLVLPHVAKARAAAAAAAAPQPSKRTQAPRGGDDDDDVMDDDDDAMDRAIEEQLQRQQDDDGDGDSRQGGRRGSMVASGVASRSSSSSSSSSSAAPGRGSASSEGPAGPDSPDPAGVGAGSSRAAAWNAAALDDPSSIISKYVRPTHTGTPGAGGSTGSGSGSAKKPTPAQAAAAKKLAAAAKGSASLTSFFGKKA